LVFLINTKQQLAENFSIKSVKIDDVSSTNDIFFDKYDFLQPVLATKNIVLLGEAEHFDETAFALKTELIKYLHEKLGFDVLLFEAGRFGFDYLNAENQKLDSVFFQNTLWDFWANSKSCRQLFEYVNICQSTENRIFAGGFDIQPSGDLFSSNNRLKKIILNEKIVKTTEEYLQKKGTSLNNYPDLKQMMYYIDYQGYLGKFQQPKYDSIKNNVDNLVSICYNPPQINQDSTFASFFKDFYNYIEMSRLQYGSAKRFQFRDSLMAEIFFDIYENKYENKKVIIWLSNLHALYDDEQYNTKFSSVKFNTFAEYLKDRYGNKMYSICFTGFANVDKNDKIFNQATHSTLEYQLHREKYKFAFIDFDKNRNILAKPFKTRINQNLIFEANWAKMCNAIFYTDTITQNK
jgi:hypothetical protein